MSKEIKFIRDLCQSILMHDGKLVIHLKEKDDEFEIIANAIAYRFTQVISVNQGNVERRLTLREDLR